MLAQIAAVGAMLLCKGTGNRITRRMLLRKGEIHRDEFMLLREDDFADELKIENHEVPVAEFEEYLRLRTERRGRTDCLSRATNSILHIKRR